MIIALTILLLIALAIRVGLATGVIQPNERPDRWEG